MSFAVILRKTTQPDEIRDQSTLPISDQKEEREREREGDDIELITERILIGEINPDFWSLVQRSRRD